MAVNKYTQFSIVANIREEEVPLIDEGLLQTTRKKEFVREITIFADYRVDDERLMDQCYLHDSKYWKLDRVVKDDKDVKATARVIKDNFKLLKDCFISIASSSRFPFISMFDFGRFMHNIKAIDENLSTGSVDNNFIAANNLYPKGQNSLHDNINPELNPDRALARYQFLEAVVRCARAKFWHAGTPPEGRSLASATKKMIALIESHKKSVIYPAQQFREEELWNYEIAGLLKKNEAKLRELVALYADRPHHDTNARVLTLGDLI